MKIIILFILCLSLQNCEEDEQSGASDSTGKFPKIIWTYWDSPPETLSLTTSLCIQNMRRHANEVGWQFRFLNGDTYMSYIKDKDRIRRILTQNKTQIFIQKKADVIRLFLIEQYGGIWADANTFFVQNLSWVQNIMNQTQIVNKRSTFPDAVLFTNQLMGGDRRIEFIENTQNQKVRIIPGIQIWFIIAKAKARIIVDWLAEFERGIMQGYPQTQKQYRRQGMRIGPNQGIQYLYGNQAIQVVLERKQKELDRQWLLNTQNPKKYAVHQYNVWCIQGEISGFKYFAMFNFISILTSKYIATKSIQELNRTVGLAKYFIKMIGPTAYELNHVVDPQKGLKPYNFGEKFVSFFIFPALHCEGFSLPNAFLTQDSYVDRFLLKPSKNQKVKGIMLFDPLQIQNNCSLDTKFYTKIAFIVAFLAVQAFMALANLFTFVNLIYGFVRKIFSICSFNLSQKNIQTEHQQLP